MLRKIIAAALGLIVLAGLVFGLAATAMYCDQVFPDGETPTLCQEVGTPLFNIVGWIVVFVLPSTAAGLYARFGWPRDKRS
jgi:hypothetical protein